MNLVITKGLSKEANTLQWLDELKVRPLGWATLSSLYVLGGRIVVGVRASECQVSDEIPTNAGSPVDWVPPERAKKLPDGGGLDSNRRAA